MARVGSTVEYKEGVDSLPEEKAPKRCECGTSLKHIESEQEAYHQEVNIEFKVLRTNKHIRSLSCPCCGKKNLYSKYLQSPVPVKYGASVELLVMMLVNQMKVSHQQAREFLEYYFDLKNVNITNLINRSTKELLRSYQKLGTFVYEQPLLYLDETGCKISGKNHYVHAICSDYLTHLMVHKSRGEEALKYNTPKLLDYAKRIMSDCYALYKKMKGRRYLCNAHILRELEFGIEQGFRWCKEFKDELFGAYRYREEYAVRYGENYWERYRQENKQRFKILVQRCKKILAEGDKEDPKNTKREKDRGKIGQTKTRNLLERLLDRLQDVLGFADPSSEIAIPFTNNEAERCLRHVKGKMKQAGCWRSLKGAINYTVHHSIFSTIKKSGLPLFETASALLSGKTLVFSGDRAIGVE